MKRTIAFLAIALHVPLASAVYRCVDERGLTLFGDTPPAGCANVPMYEMTRTGKVLRRIDPSCAICGHGSDDLVDLRDKHLCRNCVHEIRLQPA